MFNIFKIFKKKPSEPKILSKYDNITQKDFDELTEDEKARIKAYRQYAMTSVEYLRYMAFSKDHEKCRDGIHSAIGGLEPVASFCGTGLGYIVHCKCPICGEEVDITDVSSW